MAEDGPPRGRAGTDFPRASPLLAPCLLVSLSCWAAAAGWLAGGVLNRVLGWSFRMFNAGFGVATGWYTRTVGMLLAVSLIVLVVYGGLIVLTYWRFNATPKGFIPTQDMGYLLINAQLPDAASSERTQEVMDQAEQIVLSTRGIKHALVVTGQSFLLSANGSNFGSMFVILDDFDKRHGAGVDGRRHRRHAALAFARRFSKPTSPFSDRRRCAASAGPAASKS